MSSLWIKLQADIVEHPKFIGLSAEAKWAFIEMMIYSQRNLSDGFIDGRVMRSKWSAEVIEELMTNDKESPSLTKVEDDYQLHNYAKYQRSREQVEAIRQVRIETGSRGGQATAQQRNSKPSSKTVAKVQQTSSKTEANRVAKKYPDTDTDTDTDTYLANTHIPPSGGSPGRKTKLDPNWQPDEALRSWTHGLAPALDIDFERGKFVDWFAQTGKTYGDWGATWRNWIRRAVEANPTLKAAPPPPKKQFGIEPEDV
ncbi:MAG: hypothetical protein EBR82_78190 [Caulobacteraceae bacterium]|nr:hypothetical protein [Caulobacteraceae bacterium]